MTPPLTVRQGRVRKQVIAGMLGVSGTTVLALARAGQLPGAARIGNLWTFDPEKVAAHIRHLEAQALCPQTSFSARASGMPAFTPMVPNVESAYARAISKKPARGSRA